MIPARIGSERCKVKNLRLIGGKPVLAYGIEAAIAADCFDQIVVNGDSLLFKKIAEEYGVIYHHRNHQLSTSQALSDDVVYDFMQNFNSDYVVWHNAIAPWQQPEDIEAFVNRLTSDSCDSVFTVQETYLQACYNDKPVNFDTSKKFSRTQDLTPLQVFVPFLMGWNSTVYQRLYQDQGHGFFAGRVSYHPVSYRSTYTIKTDHDFRLIRAAMDPSSSYSDEIRYYS